MTIPARLRALYWRISAHYGHSLRAPGGTLWLVWGLAIGAVLAFWALRWVLP